MATVECYKEMVRKKTFAHSNPSKKVLFISTKAAKLLRTPSQSGIFRQRNTLHTTYTGYSKQLHASPLYQIPKLRIPWVSTENSEFSLPKACTQRSSASRSPRQEGNTSRTPKLSDSKAFTPRNAKKVQRFCKAKDEPSHIYYAKATEKRKVVTKPYLYVKRTRNDKLPVAKTSAISLIPPDYSVEEVMKDLMRRKEEVMNTVHRAIVIHQSYLKEPNANNFTN